ncbi:MAG: lysylphosphatidylglycerol synthase transmembrane domain-containing protein [Candidatus Zixiibacteriota bacterium]
MSLSPEGTSRETKAGQLARRFLGYAIVLVCLVWVFHDVHAERLFREIGQIQWEWILLAIFLDTFSYFAQGWRWEFLLRPTGKISPLKTTQAVYAGLFTNEIVPLRAGELVRAYLVSRWLPCDFLAVIPSMVVERLFDGIWLALGIGLTVLLVRLTGNLVQAAEILGAAVLAATGLFIYLVIRKERTIAVNPTQKPSKCRPFHLLSSLIENLAGGIRNIGVSRYLFMAFFASSLILVFQIFSFWLVMWSYGLRLSLWIGAAVLLIEHLGTTIPNAPSNLGTYQFFVVVGLTLFGVDKTTATGFSVVVFIVLTVPLWAIGLLAVGRSGMTFKEIRGEITRLMKR